MFWIEVVVSVKINESQQRLVCGIRPLVDLKTETAVGNDANSSN